ncbi:MAG TPA: hypothetical protein VFT59_00540 [Candidatus Saccharimonadales bacterium]|nr:hypothetical protein [Candidatus Saccharimonadales bacterium]
MAIFGREQELEFQVNRVLFRLRRTPISISFVTDSSLDGDRLLICERTKRFGGVRLSYNVENDVLMIEADQPQSGLHVHNTGDASVIGGGVANTGVILRSTLSHEQVEYKPAPTEEEPRWMQFKSPSESLEVTFGMGEFAYAIV